MTGLSEESKIAVFEGDEYLSSPLDPRPKFHLYRPHIAVITGISWDHMNVFPTEAEYIEQFRIFIEQMESGGILFYFSGDDALSGLVKNSLNNIRKIPYSTHPFKCGEQACSLVHDKELYPVQVFGTHNMQNINAARNVCLQLGISGSDFYEAIGTFKGTYKRLQLLKESPDFAVYLDFAHAPSKVDATVKAVRDRYPGRQLVTLLELHTFSSLNADFLPRYKGTIDLADRAVVYYNPKVIGHKKLAPLSPSAVQEAFGRSGLEVYTSSTDVVTFLESLDHMNLTLLIMSSGNFDGIDFEKLV
jgi:UDP-N-acetylmuramate: L-alanyl-gamma-D-glutamyl-meso-diaminopimelate ligase